MPSTLIEVRRPYTQEEQVGIIDAVHAALVVAFKIPEQDRHLRLLEFPPRAMVNGLEPGQPDDYTRVTIDCFSGRSLDAKRSLYERIATNLAPYGITKEHVSVLLRESPTDNWGFGGVPASEQDLGFTIEV